MPGSVFGDGDAGAVDGDVGEHGAHGVDDGCLANVHGPHGYHTITTATHVHGPHDRARWPPNRSRFATGSLPSVTAFCHSLLCMQAPTPSCGVQRCGTCGEASEASEASVKKAPVGWRLQFANWHMGCCCGAVHSPAPSRGSPASQRKCDSGSGTPVCWSALTGCWSALTAGTPLWKGRMSHWVDGCTPFHTTTTAAVLPRLCAAKKKRKRQGWVPAVPAVLQAGVLASVRTPAPLSSDRMSVPSPPL